MDGGAEHAYWGHAYYGYAYYGYSDYGYTYYGYAYYGYTYCGYAYCGYTYYCSQWEASQSVPHPTRRIVIIKRMATSLYHRSSWGNGCQPAAPRQRQRRSPT